MSKVDGVTGAAQGERTAALKAALGGLEKQFGKGAVMLLGEQGPVKNVNVIPTGSLTLDLALGVGGLPRGRVVEVFGPEAGGKTTLTLHAIAQAQRAGGTAAFIDAEHALDVRYAEKIGVDVKNLIVAQPDNGEQALEICEQLCRSGAVDVIVVDSVAALVPRAEIEGEMGDTHVGLQARLMSQALRKLTSVVSRTDCCVVFINQLRMKIGVMFGSPETTTGGNALKFYASVRLDVRRIQTLKDGDGPVGSRTRVKVVKNKLAPPFREAEFDLLYGRGVSREGELLDLGEKEDLVQKAGAWLSLKGERLGQGRENARKVLLDNKALADGLESELRVKLGLPALTTSAAVTKPTADVPQPADKKKAA